MSLIAVKQINESQLNIFVQASMSGAAFSGNFLNYVSASGYLGPLAVVTTGAQNITGVKTFLNSPVVPYSGTTGTAPSRLYVDTQDLALSAALVSASGVLAAQNAVASGISSTGLTSLSGFTITMSGQLSAFRVTGSTTIPIVNFTGLGGTLVIYSGNQVFVSGAAAGGGVDAALSGYVENSFVHRYGNEPVTGVKTFVSSPLVPNATLTGQAVNFGQLSGVSGVLAAAGGSVTNNYYITGTGVVTASFNASGDITNTFNITSGSTYITNSGTATNTFNGAVDYNINNPTGNFVNISFWYDQYNLATGLNSIETLVGRSFTFTGYGLGTINTGTQGYFSGSFYQRTSTNVKTNFVYFYLNSGTYFYTSGGYNQEISGLNRVGLDIYRLGTGITGLTIGLFGVGY